MNSPAISTEHLVRTFGSVRARLAWTASTSDLMPRGHVRNPLRAVSSELPMDLRVCVLTTILGVQLSRRIRQMSRGEQMKVRLLSSMAYRPQLLILDEPFSGLDPLVREELSGGLLELVGEDDWTVVLASHDVDELERLADRVGYIANGRLRIDESVESLQRRYRRVTARFAGVPSDDPKERKPSWQAWESSDDEVRWLDPDFDEASCRRRLERMGDVADLESYSLSLREIFVAESREERNREAGGA